MPKKKPIEFAKLKDLADLPQWLGVEEVKISGFLSDTARYYTKLRLKKRRSAGARIVYEVDAELAALQRHIARSIALTPLGTFPDHVQGFVKKRSITTNANHHLAKKIVLCVDLQSFFESINIKSVKSFFRLLGCDSIAANALAKLCTLNGKLPSGASTSPILSNIAARWLDQDMLQLAMTCSCTYTRYADDLTFSGDNVPSTQQVADIAEHHGFTCNPDKTRIQRRGKRQYVTGLTVCDPTTPRVPRRIKKNLRLALRYAEKYGLKSHYARSPSGEENRLGGMIHYVHGIEPDLGKRFLQQYKNANAVDKQK